MTTVYVVAADYGGYEGWLQPIGAFSTEEGALAAIGRVLIDGLWCATNLRVVPLSLDAPLAAENPGAKPTPLPDSRSENTGGRGAP